MTVWYKVLVSRPPPGVLIETKATEDLPLSTAAIKPAGRDTQAVRPSRI